MRTVKGRNISAHETTADGADASIDHAVLFSKIAGGTPCGKRGGTPTFRQPVLCAGILAGARDST
eukprot:12923287-Prorocentrum_lima.AAC.1